MNPPPKKNLYKMMKRSIYVVPEVELLELAVEQGFAASNVDGGSNESFEEENDGKPIW